MKLTHDQKKVRCCPACQKPVDTAYCPGCGRRMEPLKALLSYCYHRATEYENRARRKEGTEEKEVLEGLHEKWHTYFERLTKAIEALHREEDDDADN